MTSEHQPVMLTEVLEALGARAGGRYVDGTLGGGGHARAILDTSAPDGRLLGLDADEAAIERARRILERYGDRVTLLHASFQELGSVAPAHGFASCDGVLLDLGLSSGQVADPDRGFSFQTRGPLDMRFDRSRGQTAADLLNQASERQLAEIFYRYGEERRSRRLARAVVERRRVRPFVRTDDLLAVVEVSLGGRRGRLHPATRAFQALRIAVNDELAALEKGLEGAAEVLADGGRLAVISFHSLEDRIVKHFVRSRSADKTFPSLKAITRKPLTPRAEERRANPRSRSAKLRIAERLSTAAQKQG
jgi:16S rRNA (cytosine1402-N4)-methyltransferase